MLRRDRVCSSVNLWQQRISSDSVPPLSLVSKNLKHSGCKRTYLHVFIDWFNFYWLYQWIITHLFRESTEITRKAHEKMLDIISHWREVKWKSFSRVRLFTTPWAVAHQAPPSVEFSRQEYWSGLPFPSPRDLPNPEIEPRSPALQAAPLPSEPPGKPSYPLGRYKLKPQRATPSYLLRWLQLKWLTSVVEDGVPSSDTAEGDIKWFSLWKTGGQFLKRINVE